MSDSFDEIEWRCFYCGAEIYAEEPFFLSWYCWECTEAKQEGYAINAAANGGPGQNAWAAVHDVLVERGIKPWSPERMALRLTCQEPK